MWVTDGIKKDQFIIPIGAKVKQIRKYPYGFFDWYNKVGVVIAYDVDHKNDPITCITRIVVEFPNKWYPSRFPWYYEVVEE